MLHEFLHNKNTSEVRAGLTASGRSAKSGPGRLEGQISKLVHSTYPSQGGAAGNDLLPLAPLLAEKNLRKEAVVQGVEEEVAVEKVLQAMGVVSAVNFLFCAGGSKYPILPKTLGPLSPAQKEFLQRIFAAINPDDFPVEVYDLKEQIKSCTSKKVSYAGDMVSVKRDLIASKVVPAWPKVGKACVASIREVVDSQLVADLDDPDHCLLPQTEWPKETPRSKVYASEE